MQIANSKTRDQFPLSKKKIIKKTISKIIWWIIALLILFTVIIFPIIAETISSADFSFISLIIKAIGGFLIALPVLFFITYIYQRWYFAVYYYDLTDNFLTIKKGPITPREINVPYERIQDIYMDQDFLDRIFGLYDVHISSATFMSGMEAHIDGLEKDAAIGVRDLILKIVNEKINKQKHE